MVAELFARPAAGRPVLCLFGPTGTGKTRLALDLARELPIEVVSVDSAMVYRGMDVGTAKPSARERREVRHHLIDVRDPWETFSAGDFARVAVPLMEDITARGHLPVLVGGTLLYFRALFRGLAPLPEADPALRADIERRAAELGWPALHDELGRMDPEAARRIAPSDRQRIQRALEVCQLTGARLSDLRAVATPDGGDYHFLKVALLPVDRGALYSALDERLRGMFLGGLVDEVRALRALPRMGLEVPAMRAVGYRQVGHYLDGRISIEEAERAAAVATRRLAKRQLTWLRREPADLSLEVPQQGILQPIMEMLAAAGVSRLSLRCNIMGLPTTSREHGV